MKPRPRALGGSASGFTLLELLISMVLLLIVFSGAALVSKTSSQAYRQAHQQSDVQNRSRRVIDRLAKTFASSGASVLVPTTESPGWLDDVQFSQASGVTGTDVDWGPVMRVAFEYEDGETNDGADNDGDGLIDEGRVVLTTDVGGSNERRTVLCNGVAEYLEGETASSGDNNGNGLVDERGFCLERTGDVLTLRVTVVRRNDEGLLTAATTETSVRLRN